MKIHSERFKKLASSAKERVKQIERETVRNKLKTAASFYLIDVREEGEWAKGHLPHAIHLSKGVIEREIEKVIPDIDAEIVLYCSGGFRSALAADNLQEMGYTNVSSMVGGSDSWREDGFEFIS